MGSSRSHLTTPFFFCRIDGRSSFETLSNLHTSEAEEGIVLVAIVDSVGSSMSKHSLCQLVVLSDAVRLVGCHSGCQYWQAGFKWSQFPVMERYKAATGAPWICIQIMRRHSTIHPTSQKLRFQRIRISPTSINSLINVLLCSLPYDIHCRNCSHWNEAIWFVYCRYHEKTSYVLNYAFFTLLHKWVHRGRTHHFEKLQ